MLSLSYVRLMARYNAWQNTCVYEACERLNDAQRKEDRGAFFGSIHATLNHILWADQIWLMRFDAAPPPAKRSLSEGLSLFDDWQALSAERSRFDDVIANWADVMDMKTLEGDMTWISGATGREMTRPKALLVAHIFNHQTHHRGQVSAMLTGFGAKTGITDLAFMQDALLADLEM
jgi:uncharacterized damage-inducible protein DinB